MPGVSLAPAFVPEAMTPGRAKMPPELRALLSDPAAKETPVHVVVLFTMPITDRIEELRSTLAGRFGPSVKRLAMEVSSGSGRPAVALTTGATLEARSAISLPSDSIVPPMRSVSRPKLRS